MSVSAIILAAGEGKRMKSKLPKVMHKVASRSMICHILDLTRELDIKETVAVIGPNMDMLREHILAQGMPINCAVQENRLGTADAVRIGLDHFEAEPEDVLVLYGDTPFISKGTIEKMKVLLSANPRNALVVLGFDMTTPSEYGRLIVNDKHELEAIIEYSDCTLEQQDISLCNSGVMLLSKKHATELLSKVQNNNAKKEYYLTDLVAIAKETNLLCQYVAVHKEEAIAINSREELHTAEMVIQSKMRDEFVKKGVTLIDKNTVFFARDTKIENDVVIYPNVFFGPNVEVKSGSVIKSFSFLEDTKIGNNVSVGPFANLRPGTIVEDEAAIGNFVEIKSSVIGKRSKVKHLSYIGNAHLGTNVNIGAGTITCNYDGVFKHKTKINDDSFIGSNTALVAPLEIGKGAMIGAGSTITKNIPENALALARSAQTNLENKAKKLIDQKKLSKSKKLAL